MSYTHQDKAGYIRLYVGINHLLSFGNGMTYEHRLVLFDKIGYGPHRCQHCGKHINWRTGLEADHLDGNRSNNAPDNLVPSCIKCNRERRRNVQAQCDRCSRRHHAKGLCSLHYYRARALARQTPSALDA